MTCQDTLIQTELRLTPLDTSHYASSNYGWSKVNMIKRGWDQLLSGTPSLADGGFPLPAYSEFMPPPRVGQSPYGTFDRLMLLEHEQLGWPVTEIEEEFELRPGLEHIAQHVIEALVKLSHAEAVHPLSGHQHLNLTDNPYWPAELAKAGVLRHERFVLLLPLALSRTQDDMGRVRWTLFGSSEQGPERAFWKGFTSPSGREVAVQESRSFID